MAAGETLAFAFGAAVGFALVGAAFMAVFARSLTENPQIVTIRGVVDLLSVASAVAVTFGLSRIAGFWAWPLTGAGTAATYLVVGGFDVLIARARRRDTARSGTRNSLGRCEHRGRWPVRRRSRGRHSLVVVSGRSAA